MDPVARAREIAARLAAAAIPQDSSLGKRKSRWEDDAAGPGPKKNKKVYIPVDKYPDINFMGLLIGPRGSNQKRMEDESGAKILIRGKGSSKDDDPNEMEELHVLITGDSDEAIAKAQSAVENILFNPQEAMRLKQEQLRRVAELNGTLNDNYGRSDTGGGSSGYGRSDGGSGAGGGSSYGRSDSGGPPGGSSGYGGSSGGGGGGPGYYGPGSSSQTTDMQVPRELVGYIIGRGGDTIRELQAKSGARMQIVREEPGAPQTPHRLVSIAGSSESIETAKALVQKLIDERMNGGRDFGGRDNDRGPSSGGGRYGGGGLNPDGSETMEFHVPNERVGLIIGRGGATIKDIQMRTGASINIPQTADPNHPTMRLLTITGTREAKESAKVEINSILNDDGSGRRGGSGFQQQQGSTIYMQVPNDRVGVVIGKRGETIKSIQDRYGVRVQIPTDADANNPVVRTISIQGPADALTRAKDEIDMVILNGAGTQGTGTNYGGGSQYGAGQYGSAAGSTSNYYGTAAGGGAAAGYDQYGASQYGGASASAGQYGGYDQSQYAAYNQQYAAAAAPATAVAAGTDATAAAAPAGASANDPNDPNAYWNGFYEYAAYYGIDAANEAWGVTGEAAVASAESYRQYQEQAAAAASAGVAAAADGASASVSASASSSAPSQAQGPPGV